MSVRIPGAASAPPRPAGRSGAGRQPLDAGCHANAPVASSRLPAAATSATRVDAVAASPSVIGGPAIQANSASVAWSETAVRTWLGSCTTAGSAARRHAATGGVHRPSAAARPATRPTLVPTGSTAIVRSMTVDAPAVASSTPVWPRRSASRPITGPPAPSAAAYAADTSPAAATEPVSRAVWTSRAMLSVASGSWANVEVARRRRALRLEVIDCIPGDATVYWCRNKIHFYRYE